MNWWGWMLSWGRGMWNAQVGVCSSQSETQAQLGDGSGSQQRIGIWSHVKSRLLIGVCVIGPYEEDQSWKPLRLPTLKQLAMEEEERKDEMIWVVRYEKTQEEFLWRRSRERKQFQARGTDGQCQILHKSSRMQTENSLLCLRKRSSEGMTYCLCLDKEKRHWRMDEEASRWAWVCWRSYHSNKTSVEGFGDFAG